MTLDTVINVGDLITACGVLVSAFAVVLTWLRAQNQRTREEADRIRRAVGILVAKADRWIEYSLGIGNEMQSTITDIDIEMATLGNQIASRDRLWQEIVRHHNDVLARIRDEGIEIAYAELAGYDIRVRELYIELVRQLVAIDDSLFKELLTQTQAALLEVEGKTRSAAVGNVLRFISSEVLSNYSKIFEETAMRFREIMWTIVDAKDRAIVNRSIELPQTLGLENSTKEVSFRLQNQTSGSDSIPNGFQDPSPSDRRYSAARALERLRPSTPTRYCALNNPADLSDFSELKKYLCKMDKD